MQIQKVYILSDPCHLYEEKAMIGFFSPMQVPKQLNPQELVNIFSATSRINAHATFSSAEHAVYQARKMSIVEGPNLKGITYRSYATSLIFGVDLKAPIEITDNATLINLAFEQLDLTVPVEVKCLEDDSAQLASVDFSKVEAKYFSCTIS